MANPGHLKILRQGVKVWNDWRRSNPKIHPELAGEDFRGRYFEGINFATANLFDVNFTGANLGNALLQYATLIKANLTNANLSEAVLSGANLVESKCSQANLTNANLYNAQLTGAIFDGSLLRKANVTKAKLRGTVFSRIDLQEVVGLEEVEHYGPSSISIDTLYSSQGKIPEEFLRGCGVPDEIIFYMHSLTASGRPIQFYSCFISYSSQNQLFADRLYADLQNKGVRCWLASEDLKIGDKIRIGIDESIRFHDKLLLVLTKHSVASDWVEQEVETAFDRERKENRTVFFPIRLDDTAMKIDTGWPALIKNTRNIGDFRKWKNPEAYQKAFDRLLRDLRAEVKKP